MFTLVGDVYIKFLFAGIDKEGFGCLVVECLLQWPAFTSDLVGTIGEFQHQCMSTKPGKTTHVFTEGGFGKLRNG